MAKTYHISPFFFCFIFPVLLMVLWVINLEVGWAQNHYRISRGDLSSLEAMAPRTIGAISDSSDPSMHKLYLSYLSTKAVLKAQVMKSNQDLFIIDVFFLIFLLLMTMAILNILIFTRVVYTGKYLYVYYPHLAVFGVLTPPKEAIINGTLNLFLTRTTPLGPDISDTVKMNWRDIISIGGVAIPGYVFSGIGDLYKRLVTDYPDIKTIYHKNTLAENADNYLNSHV